MNILPSATILHIGVYRYDIATLHSSSELYFGTIEAIHTPLYCMRRVFSG